MIYNSLQPKVVGEFDAAAVNAELDGIAARHPGISKSDVVLLLEDRGPEVDWLLGARRGFEGDTTFNRSSVQQFNGRPKALDADIWHPDSIENPLFVLPRILIGASRWPTEFLIGQITVYSDELRPLDDFHDRFWESEAGEQACAEALRFGDAAIYKPEPGEILKVPRGCLHRRRIPPGFIGFRYFYREFPNRLTNAGTNLGPLSLF